MSMGTRLPSVREVQEKVGEERSGVSWGISQEIVDDLKKYLLNRVLRLLKRQEWKVTIDRKSALVAWSGRQVLQILMT